jgi:hypothetical protein
MTNMAKGTEGRVWWWWGSKGSGWLLGVGGLGHCYVVINQSPFDGP